MKRLVAAGRETCAYTGGTPFDASRPAVVLLHGALNDHSVWSLPARYLAHHGWAVLALDQPGHGQSPGPALASVEALADWTVACLASAGVERAALVGHSLGSLVALETAARLGERATALVLVATAFPMAVPAELLRLAEEAPLRAIDRVNATAHSTLAAWLPAPGPGTWLHGAGRALMRRQQAAYAEAGHGNLFRHDFAVCDAYRGAPAAATQVRCTAHLVIGAKDRMTLPASAFALGETLHATATTLPCGHAVMQEAPEALLDALLVALRSAADGR